MLYSPAYEGFSGSSRPIVDSPTYRPPCATAMLAGGDAGVGDPGVIAKSLELQNEALQRQLGERTVALEMPCFLYFTN